MKTTFDPRIVSELQLKLMTVEHLAVLREKMAGEANLSPIKAKLLTKITHELTERYCEEAKAEFMDSNSVSIVDEVIRLKAIKPKNFEQRARYSYLIDSLITRHPDLALRTDLYTNNNPIGDWDAVFFGLITDIDNH